MCNCKVCEKEDGHFQFSKRKDLVKGYYVRYISKQLNTSSLPLRLQCVQVRLTRGWLVTLKSYCLGCPTPDTAAQPQIQPPPHPHPLIIATLVLVMWSRGNYGCRQNLEEIKVIIVGLIYGGRGVCFLKKLQVRI